MGILKPFLNTKWLLILVYAVGILLLLWLWYAKGVDSLQSWLAEAGPYAYVLFLLLYLLCSLAFLPVAWLNLAAGFLFGPILGTIFITLGVILASSVSFFISRYFVEPIWLREKVSVPFIQKIIADPRAWKAVLVLRLSNVVPFAVVNYLSGAMAIRYTHYLAATILGSLPGTILYSGLGAMLYGALKSLPPP